MIRNSKEFEYENLANLWLRSTIKAHPFIPEKYWMDNFEIVKNQYFPNSKTFVYEIDSKILAFASIMNDNFIGAFFVDVDYQHQGIGTKLIQFLQEKYSSLELSVYKENTLAYSFYHKNCFIDIKEGFSEGHCEITMKWTKT